MRLSNLPALILIQCLFLTANLTKAQDIKTVLQPSFESAINTIQIGPNGEYYLTAEGDISTFGGMRVKLWDYRSKLMIHSLHLSSINGPGSGQLHIIDNGRFYLSINQHILLVDLLNNTTDTVYSCTYPEYMHAFLPINKDKLLISTKRFPVKGSNINDITNQAAIYHYSIPQKNIIASKSLEMEAPALKVVNENTFLIGTNKAQVLSLDAQLQHIYPPIKIKDIHAIRFLDLSKNKHLIINEAIGEKKYYSPIGEGALQVYSYPEGEFIQTIDFEEEDAPKSSSIFQINPSKLISDIVTLPHSQELIVKYGFSRLARISLNNLKVTNHSPDLAAREIDGLSFNSRTNEFMFTFGPLALFSQTDSIAIYSLNDRSIHSIIPPPQPSTGFKKILYPLNDSYVWGMQLSEAYYYNSYHQLIGPNFQDSTIIHCEGCDLMISPNERQWIFRDSREIVVATPDFSVHESDTFHFKFPSWWDGDLQEGIQLIGQELLQEMTYYKLFDFPSKYYLNRLIDYIPHSNQFLVIASKKRKRYLMLVDSTGNIIEQFNYLPVETSLQLSPNKKSMCIAFEGGEKKKSFIKIIDLETLKINNLYETKVDILTKPRFDINGSSIYFQTGMFNKEGELIMSLNKMDLSSSQVQLIHQGDYYSEFKTDERNDLLFVGTEEGAMVLKLSTAETLYHSTIRIAMDDDIVYYPHLKKILYISSHASGLLDPNTNDIIHYFQYPGNRNILLSDEGYYMSPGFNPTQFSFVFNHRAYPFKEFDLIYNRPDILLKKSNLLVDEHLALYEKAYLKRKINNEGATDPNGLNAIPKAQILNDSLAFVTDKSTVDLQLSFTDTHSKINSYHVWVNGVPLYGSKGEKLTDPKHVITLNTTLELSAGDNFIEVACTNAEGLSSLRSHVQMRCNKETQAPTTFFIGIGVSHYQDSSYDLKYAVKDVKDLEKALKTEEKVVSNLLFDKEVTKENIAALRTLLEQAKIDDRVILSYSGHGILTDDLDFYFSTHAMDFKSPEKHGLKFNIFDELLDGIVCRNKIMLIDACNSGLVDRDTTISSLAPGIAASNAAFNNKGIEVESTEAVSTEDAFVLMQSLFSDLSSGNGSTVISASGSKEYAFESGEWNNGVFTYAILKGLKDQSADLNLDGYINVTELRRYVEQQVLSLTHGAQRPTSRQDNVLNDFVLF